MTQTTIDRRVIAASIMAWGGMALKWPAAAQAFGVGLLVVFAACIVLEDRIIVVEVHDGPLPGMEPGDKADES